MEIKKLMVMAAVVSAALFGQAAAVDWLYTAGDADVGKNVYAILGSTAKTSWESLEALQAAAFSGINAVGTVAKSGRTSFVATGLAKSAELTADNANLYFVIVDKAGETFDVTSVADFGAMVYDPDNQGTSPGQFKGLTSSSIVSSGNKFGGGDPSGVPEPTSGLLLLLGVAGLALRRKQA